MCAMAQAMAAEVVECLPRGKTAHAGGFQKGQKKKIHRAKRVFQRDGRDRARVHRRKINAARAHQAAGKGHALGAIVVAADDDVFCPIWLRRARKSSSRARPRRRARSYRKRLPRSGAHPAFRARRAKGFAPECTLDPPKTNIHTPACPNANPINETTSCPHPRKHYSAAAKNCQIRRKLAHHAHEFPARAARHFSQSQHFTRVSRRCAKSTAICVQKLSFFCIIVALAQKRQI